MKLLDLFCCAGGAGMGYHLAGFDVVGVDINFQPRYPFEFHQADAFEFLAGHSQEFDFIHASPPCQLYSEATPETHRKNHPDLIAPIREALLKTGKPFVIENVEMARRLLVNPVMLCGSMFGMKIWRHRYFEIHPSMFILTSPCNHGFVPILITGMGSTRLVNGKRYKSPVAEKRKAINIDWMTTDELSEAIPPAYTEFLGKKLLANTALLSNTGSSRLFDSGGALPAKAIQSNVESPE